MNTKLSFDEALSLAAVTQCFHGLERSHLDVLAEKVRIPPGADRITYDEFHRDRDKHLRAISRKALAGRYTFSPLLEFPKDKEGSTELRIISVSSIRDAIVQRALSNYLYPIIDEKLSECVFGYRKGRSAHQAVTKIVSHIKNGKRAVFDADFSKFFDSVNHALLIRKLDELSLDPRALKLVFRWLKSARITIEDREYHKQHEGGKQIKYRTTPRLMGVPQGGILSGLISNLYLAEFDRELLRIENAYVRYADDFVVCCNNYEDCVRIRKVAEEQAELLSLNLNDEKTRTHIAADEGFNFLGFLITDNKVSVRSKNMAKFKNRVMKVIDSQKERASLEKTLGALCRRLSYKIRGPKKEDIEKLLAAGQATHPYRRCWVGFFRVVTNERQIWNLDRWIRKQISGYFWRKYRVRIRYEQMKKAGLLSLIGIMHKARKAYSTEAPVTVT